MRSALTADEDDAICIYSTAIVRLYYSNVDHLLIVYDFKNKMLVEQDICISYFVFLRADTHVIQLFNIKVFNVSAINLENVFSRVCSMVFLEYAIEVVLGYGFKHCIS